MLNKLLSLSQNFIMQPWLLKSFEGRILRRYLWEAVNGERRGKCAHIHWHERLFLLSVLQTQSEAVKSSFDFSPISLQKCTLREFLKDLDEKHYVNSRCLTDLWSIHRGEGRLFCGFLGREKRILLTLPPLHVYLTVRLWLLFCIISGLFAAWGHGQVQHRASSVSASRADTSCN